MPETTKCSGLCMGRHPPLTTSIFSSFCARSTTSPTSSANLCSCRRSRSSRRSLLSSSMRTWQVETGWAGRQKRGSRRLRGKPAIQLGVGPGQGHSTRAGTAGKAGAARPARVADSGNRNSPGSRGRYRAIAEKAEARTILGHAVLCGPAARPLPTLVASCSASQWRGRIAGLRRSPTRGTQAR